MSGLPATAGGTWVLGDRAVARIGLGAMRLPGNGVFSTGTSSSRERASEVLRTAVELGVNHIDTASFYFSQLRSANELINSTLAPYPADLVIVTKIGPSRDAAGDWLPHATPDRLRGLVEENLRQLGLDSLHLVYLRMSDEMDLMECLDAMASLQSEGLYAISGFQGLRCRNSRKR